MLTSLPFGCIRTHLWQKQVGIFAFCFKKGVKGKIDVYKVGYEDAVAMPECWVKRKVGLMII